MLNTCSQTAILPESEGVLHTEESLLEDSVLLGASSNSVGWPSSSWPPSSSWSPCSVTRIIAPDDSSFFSAE